MSKFLNSPNQLFWERNNKLLIKFYGVYITPTVSYESPVPGLVYYIQEPGVVYTSDSISQYPTYIHGAPLDLVIVFNSSDINEYPEYIHGGDIIGTPTLLFGSSDEKQFPTYTQVSTSDLVVEAGLDDNIDQWAKYVREITPLGPEIFTFNISGLPTGLTYTDDGVTAKIEGIPSVTGAFLITVEVTDRVSRVDSDTFTITIAADTKVPLIEDSVPDIFANGVDVIITGYNFGATAGSLYVDSVLTPTISWSDDEIEFTVPVASNPSDIYVVAGGQTSNTISRIII